MTVKVSLKFQSSEIRLAYITRPLNFGTLNESVNVRFALKLNLYYIISMGKIK